MRGGSWQPKCGFVFRATRAPGERDTSSEHDTSDGPCADRRQGPSQCILTSMPRMGGEVTMQMGIPESTSDDKYRFVGTLRIVGDMAIYVYEHGAPSDDFSSDYPGFVEMDSWKEPGSPV